MQFKRNYNPDFCITKIHTPVQLQQNKKSKKKKRKKNNVDRKLRNVLEDQSVKGDGTFCL
jgi:hypothetical protein